jgi:hypothetical protein
MKTQNYRIIKNTYYDQQGVGKAPIFTIQKRKSFLGIRFWVYIQSDNFESLESAKMFIKDILDKNKPVCKWEQNVVFDFTLQENKSKDYAYYND